MSGSMKVLAVLLAVVILVAGIGVSTKNRIVRLDEGINESWAQVETVLQRRYDLIPNVVNTVKGFAEQEKTVLTDITKYRSQWGAAQSVDQKVEAANGMEGALARLLVVAERYPDLKSDANFRMLQDELAGSENRIAVERRRYNEAVRAYNTKVRQFPGSLFGYATRNVYFEAKPEAKEVPKVQF